MRFLTCLALSLAPAAFAADAPTVPQAPQPAAAPAEADVIAGFNKENAGVRLDAQKRWLDFDAKVCLREAPMLEVFVCLAMTREHESVLVSSAKPSRIHLGLLLMGLEPGTPRSVRWVGPKGDEPQVIPASGPEVELFVVYKKKSVEDGKTVEKEVEVPASHMLIDAKTRKEAGSNRWIFCGSRWVKDFEGRPFYAADGEGNIASVVNFGDEVLAPHNPKTKENNSAGEDLVCNSEAIPEENTPVVVRIKPVKKPEAAAKTAEAPAAKE